MGYIPRPALHPEPGAVDLGDDVLTVLDDRATILNPSLPQSASTFEICAAMPIRSCSAVE
jgi:hypothetical protein